MTVRVVSLCWGTAWDRYGRKFSQSFARYWPVEVELVLVTDKPINLPRGTSVSLQDIPGYQAFMDRWSSDLRAMGQRPPTGSKTNENGYSWRHDAVKWMPQALAPMASIDGLEDGDILAWFDADTETHKQVPSGWIDGLLGDADVACLQRNNRHTEIGFYAMRLGEKTRRILNLFARFYTDDAVFKLSEWHSAYVWDRAVETEAVTVKNLNVRGVKGHPFPTSALGEYCAHHKGKRKDP